MNDFSFDELSTQCNYLPPSSNASDFPSIVTSQGETSLPNKKGLNYVKGLLNHSINKTLIIHSEIIMPLE